MGWLLAVIGVGMMLYSLFTGSVPVRRRQPIRRAEQPAYYWFLILIQVAIGMVGLLDGLGMIDLFN